MEVARTGLLTRGCTRSRSAPYDRFLIEQLAGDLLPGAAQLNRSLRRGSCGTAWSMKRERSFPNNSA